MGGWVGGLTWESKSMRKESAAPTAERGMMVALKRAAIRTNSLFSGQKSW